MGQRGKNKDDKLKLNHSNNHNTWKWSNTLIFKCRDCHIRFENENSIIYCLFKQFKYEETKRLKIKRNFKMKI